jgi:hypothetical protein
VGVESVGALTGVGVLDAICVRSSTGVAVAFLGKVRVARGLVAEGVDVALDVIVDEGIGVELGVNVGSGIGVTLGRSVAEGVSVETLVGNCTARDTGVTG